MDSHKSNVKLFVDAKCRETIETSYPLFVIHTNHVTTLPDETLFNLCQRIYTSAIANLSLTQQSSTLDLRKILSAVFDTDHRAFVLDTPDQRLFAVLDEDARACIFAQAIAGIVYFLRKVAACSISLTPEAFEAKLARFAESDERKAILENIEKSPIWDNCFEKAQIGNMIVDAIDGRSHNVSRAVSVGPVDDKKDSTAVSVVAVDKDLFNEPAFNDGPHLERGDLGVPGGFTIMALN